MREFRSQIKGMTGGRTIKSEWRVDDRLKGS